MTILYWVYPVKEHNKTSSVVLDSYQSNLLLKQKKIYNEEGGGVEPKVILLDGKVDE